jgi:DNA mismatch repair protein MutL
MSLIKNLPPEVIHLIAAGEVIDSLAAVVRELVENSLDAQATRIAISLYPELWSVQVADNGRGMILTDLHNCAKAHSTSKISSREDLWRIRSLGFRGEALYSLAQVAELEIASRPASDPSATGWRIVYNQQGKQTMVETAAIAPGTIVTVTNLFGKLPVRRQGLPSLPQQLKAVQRLVEQIALCHPHLTWQVRQNDQPWFNISPGNNSQQILPQILKQVKVSDLQQLELEVETPANSESQIQKPKSKIELVIGLPDRCHRRRPDWVKIAVNGRMVRLPELETTILAAFSRTLPRDRFPICFLHLQVCPSQIDWNRHPAKAEIYLHSLKFWQEKVAQAMAKALELSAANISDNFHNQRVGKLLKVAEKKEAYQINSQSKDEISLIELRAIAQVHNTYIVAEHPRGLWLIEQHIAHERVLYEQLQDEWKLLPLETPIILSQLNPSQLEQLERLGLEIEPFGEDLWAVRKIPAMLSQREDCAEALVELSLGGDLQTAQVATACRSAIRNGTLLNLLEMQALLDQWKVTRNPRTCPHGRPIFLSLEETSLARFFRRHWVIGKSHGI